MTENGGHFVLETCYQGAKEEVFVSFARSVFVPLPHDRLGISSWVSGRRRQAIPHPKETTELKGESQGKQTVGREFVGDIVF